MKVQAYPDYPIFLAGLKERILHARTTAVRAVNRELILLYWDIGHRIVEKQKQAGWGDSVVERLAADLRGEFPEIRGFSARNVRDMKRMYLVYSDDSIWRQVVAKLNRNETNDGVVWPHVETNIETASTQAEFLHQIKAQAYERAVTEKKVHNFPLALPEYLAEQADEMMKSSYNLEFLGITRAVRERELEDRLPSAKQLAEAVRSVLPNTGKGVD